MAVLTEKKVNGQTIKTNYDLPSNFGVDAALASARTTANNNNPSTVSGTAGGGWAGTQEQLNKDQAWHDYQTGGGTNLQEFYKSYNPTVNPVATALTAEKEKSAAPSYTSGGQIANSTTDMRKWYLDQLVAGNKPTGSDIGQQFGMTPSSQTPATTPQPVTQQPPPSYNSDGQIVNGTQGMKDWLTQQLVAQQIKALSDQLAALQQQSKDQQAAQQQEAQAKAQQEAQSKAQQQLINDQAAANLAATLASYQKKRDNDISASNTSIAALPGEYQPLRDQASFQGAKGVNTINETMAGTGRFDSGNNVTAQTANATGTASNINSLNTQQQDKLTGLQKAIAQANSDYGYNEATATQQSKAQQMAALIAQGNTDRGYALSEAELLGALNGTPTLAAQQLAATIAQNNKQNTYTEAGLTGTLGGTSTLAGKSLAEQIAQNAKNNTYTEAGLTGTLNGTQTLVGKSTDASIEGTKANTAYQLLQNASYPEEQRIRMTQAVATLTGINADNDIKKLTIAGWPEEQAIRIAQVTGYYGGKYYKNGVLTTPSPTNAVGTGVAGTVQTLPYTIANNYPNATDITTNGNGGYSFTDASGRRQYVSLQ